MSDNMRNESIVDKAKPYQERLDKQYYKTGIWVEIDILISLLRKNFKEGNWELAEVNSRKIRNKLTQLQE